MRVLVVALLPMLACAHSSTRPASQAATVVLKSIARNGVLPLAVTTIREAFPASEQSRLRTVIQEAEGAPVRDIEWRGQSGGCYAYFAVPSPRTQEVHNFWFRCLTPNREQAKDLLLRWIGTFDWHLRDEIASKVNANNREFYEEARRAISDGRISMIAAVENDHGRWAASLQLMLGNLPVAVMYSRDWIRTSH